MGKGADGMGRCLFRGIGMPIRVMACSGGPEGLIRAGGKGGRLCCDEVKNETRESVKQESWDIATSVSAL